MKLELDFEDLNKQWKSRQFDLFPWLDGLFALLRTKEALIRETKKRLSSAMHSTMVQFLASDDRDNAQVAREIIKEQDIKSILPILLYSLERVDKGHYPRRVMESLLDFDPQTSFGYLLGYLNLRPNQQHKIYQVFNEIFPLKNIFPESKDGVKFLTQSFQALLLDLKDRMPTSGRLQTMDDLESVRLNLKVMLWFFNKTWQGMHAEVVEKEIKMIGQTLIKSFHQLPFVFENDPDILMQLSEIIPLMAIMRLEEDKSFLKGLPLKLKSAHLSEDEMENFKQKAENALQIIDQPKKLVRDILDEYDVPLFLGCT